MESIEKMFSAAGDFDHKINSMITYSDDQYHNLFGMGNALRDKLSGDCGPKPRGIGKKHEAKLAAWEECKKTLSDLKLKEKAGKISAKEAETQANEALARAAAIPDSTKTDITAPDPNAPTGMSMAAIVGIAVGGAVLIGIVIFAISRVGKTKAKQA